MSTILLKNRFFVNKNLMYSHFKIDERLIFLGKLVFRIVNKLSLFLILDKLLYVKVRF